MTGDSKQAQVARTRRDFFDYFRQRLAVTRDGAMRSPERMVLLTASLDALANHWASTTAGPDVRSIKNVDRLRLFLERHGGHEAYGRVSAPLLRASDEVTPAQRSELGGHFPFARYRTDALNEVSTWNQDPCFSTLASATSAFNRETLVRFSYGGLLYKRLRCGWLHEFMARDEDIMTPEVSTIHHEPYYLYAINTQRFIFVVPVVFLVATLERAIDSFDAEATKRDIVPFKE